MRMTKKELREYHLWLVENYPMCQDADCNNIANDHHHVIYGRFGADKDDSIQINLCNKHHRWAHNNKKESQERYKFMGETNYLEYKAERGLL